MKIITVSGAHSGVGKTKIAEMLLRRLKGWSALKVTVTHRGNSCPVQKDCSACDELNSDFAIESSRKIIEQEGKDTRRLKEAGARKVLWLKAKPEALEIGMRKVLALLKGAKGLIIESNSALKYLQPDLAIFVKNRNSVLKLSAKEIFNKADLVITNTNAVNKASSRGATAVARSDSDEANPMGFLAPLGTGSPISETGLLRLRSQ